MISTNKVFADLPVTIFEAMSQLARDNNAINLGQGFPDDPGPEDIRRAAADARAVMLAEGIEANQIAEGTYDGTGARSAPLILTYRTYNAVVPNCPDISHWDFAWTGSNNALPSFGCATAVNLAAQIADALLRVSSVVRWAHLEKLQEFDGAPGYTKSQGED